MLEERDLIPFEPALLPPGPWLVFAPHPDDETFGMGGSIALASQQGIRVDVVVVTDGEGAGDAETRRREVLKAGEILGVERHHFWSIPDRGVSQVRLEAHIVASLLDSIEPQTIFLPGIQEFHPDHRSTARLVLAGLKAVRFAGGIWLYEVSRQNEANKLVDITSVLGVKKRAILCFASQLAQNDYEQAVLALNSSRAYTLPKEVASAEAFWSCGSIDDVSDPIRAQYNALYRYRANLPLHGYPLVTVVVRTKDRHALLLQALDSLACQTYRPIEVVIVNDGGHSLPVQSLQEKLPGLTLNYVQHPTTRGRAGSANTGIQEATGDFVCFLDDDDLFYPTAVETLIGQAGHKRMTHAKARCVTYGAAGEADWETAHDLGAPLERGKLILENYIAFNTICVPRAALHATGPLDEELEIYEDWDLLIRLSSQCDMFFIDQVVSEYRIFGSATVTGKGGAGKQALYRKKVLNKHVADVSAADILDFVQSSVDRAVLDKDKKINLLQDKLHQMEQNNHHLQHTLQELHAMTKGFEREISQLQQDIQARETEIQELNQTLKTREAEMLELKQSLEGLKNAETQLQEILASTSWRMTKPLRLLKNLLQFWT